MPELIAPTTRLHASWLEARAEWPPDAHLDGHGLHPGDDVASAAGFAALVARLHAEADPFVEPAAGWVHCTYRWIVEDDRFLGSVSLRHRLNDALFERGGHIGYGVRPSARRRGLAGWALGGTLPLARSLGLDRVLVTCTEDNVASARTIERNGGVLEDVREGYRRYWIELA
ncbi:GNAT family N-acetyltransferase [Actinoplanes sp. URMC 104]|uniref:GNAT family N-acetyltransferase n=1 Tax=Actinoplanes sp. URMC 104 TaxID=3423409 RepID=UPI003F1A6A4B